MLNFQWASFVHCVNLSQEVRGRSQKVKMALMHREGMKRGGIEHPILRTVRVSNGEGKGGMG